jgi:hypothetical protein
MKTRQVAWHREPHTKSMLLKIFGNMGFRTTDIELALLRFEQGHPPITEFEKDVFEVCAILARLYKTGGDIARS